MQFKVGDKVFYYGSDKKHYGGIYSIIGRLSESKWKLKGGERYAFFAKEDELQPVKIIYDCTEGVPKQLFIDFDRERF